MAATPTSSRWRLSNREVKEESYRALRAAGYDWGRSTAAGRVVSSMQLIWGSGIRAVVADVTRWPWRSQVPKVTVGATHSSLDARGLSAAIVGPPAVALAVSRPGRPVAIRGAGCGPQFAAAVWDLGGPPYPAVWWGVRSAAGIDGWAVTHDGALWRLGRGNGTATSPGVRRWTMSAEQPPPGQIELSEEERQDRVTDASSGGVAVLARDWNALMAKARKFLVPEK